MALCLGFVVRQSYYGEAGLFGEPWEPIYRFHCVVGTEDLNLPKVVKHEISKYEAKNELNYQQKCEKKFYEGYLDYFCEHTNMCTF